MNRRSSSEQFKPGQARPERALEATEKERVALLARRLFRATACQCSPVAVLFSTNVSENGDGEFPQRSMDFFEEFLVLLAETVQRVRDVLRLAKQYVPVVGVEINLVV
jgi:hypothetical protein